jgi:hypothetical protein
MRLPWPTLLVLLALAAPQSRADEPPPTAEIHKPAAVLGTDVKTTDGTVIGRIVDVLVGKAGQPMAAVVNVGGFLGVGTRQVAVDWSHLHFAAGNTGPATVDLTPDQLQAAPEYKGSSGAVHVVGASPAPPAGTAATAAPMPPAQASPPAMSTPASPAPTPPPSVSTVAPSPPAASTPTPPQTAAQPGLGVPPPPPTAVNH